MTIIKLALNSCNALVKEKVISALKKEYKEYDIDWCRKHGIPTHQETLDIIIRDNEKYRK